MVLAGLRNPEVPTESDPVFLALVPRCQKVRCFGAAAPDLCWVAAGKADAYVDQGLWAWDFAAGNLIVQQAGGRVKVQPLSFEKRRHRLLAAPPALFSELDPLVFAE
jgi:myo-inositol-1(or 4)-monophosphatase